MIQMSLGERERERDLLDGYWIDGLVLDGLASESGKYRKNSGWRGRESRTANARARDESEKATAKLLHKRDCRAWPQDGEDLEGSDSTS